MFILHVSLQVYRRQDSMFTTYPLRAGAQMFSALKCPRPTCIAMEQATGMSRIRSVARTVSSRRYISGRSVGRSVGRSGYGARQRSRVFLAQVELSQFSSLRADKAQDKLQHSAPGRMRFAPPFRSAVWSALVWDEDVMSLARGERVARTSWKYRYSLWIPRNGNYWRTVVSLARKTL